MNLLRLNSEVVQVHECFQPKAADLALKMVPEGVKVSLTDFKSVLSTEEHNMMCKKLLMQFETSVASLPFDVARSMCLGAIEQPV